MNPFIFLRHRDAVHILVRKLESLRLEVLSFEDSDSVFVPAKIKLMIPWQRDMQLEIL